MPSHDTYRGALKRLAAHLATALDIPLSLRLWDGTVLPLGKAAPADRALVLRSPGALGAIMRKPSLDTLFRRYVQGDIDLEGIDLLGLMGIARDLRRQKPPALSRLRRGFPWVAAMPLFLARAETANPDHRYAGDDTGRKPRRKGDQDFIQFHYDLSNAFYALFLDSEMVYSCAYFTDWSTTLEQAQIDKLDHICRKLRLKPGERFLDIGCGWGALICHAARNYGVEAHGVTLSQAQLDHAKEKIRSLGLADRVTVELKDFRALEGSFDKIASIGMYEHVGIANYPAYFAKMRALLAEDGIFLNHGITRRAKRDMRDFGKISSSKRIMLRYIFPGSELDHIGHTLQEMESAGFEVHDVENLRLHYGRTCTIWHDRLAARRTEAVALIGEERTRMWLAYLAGVVGAFEENPLRIYQTVATKHLRRERMPLPPTRKDLYT